MLNTNNKREYEWSVRLQSTCNSRQKAVIVWIRNHQRFCLSLVCLETQEHSDHICMFNELRWILWSQTLFNIVINKERNVLKCFFHIVNNIKEKEKGVKLGETTGYFLHYRLFCSPVSQCLSAHICRPLEPFRTTGWLYRKQNPSNSHQRAGQTQRSPKISSGFCVAYEGNRTRTSWMSLQYYFLASWNGFWPF